MPYLSKYHMSEQQASVLLGPVSDALAELERRTQHHAERLLMSDADHAAMVAAQHALAAAREEIERIRRGSSHPAGNRKAPAEVGGAPVAAGSTPIEASGR
jgi:hypothetical protein